MMVICIKQFMEKLSNTDAELKKNVAYKKKRVVLSCRRVSYLDRSLMISSYGIIPLIAIYLYIHI